MGDLLDLRESLISIEESIDHQLRNRVTRPYETCKNFGERLWGLIGYYRPRAILKYLLDADTDAFFADLTREALTYLTFLKAYRSNLNVPRSRVDGSTYAPLTSALAAGHIELCGEIDRLMPREISEYDGNELFAFTSLLRRLIVGEDRDVRLAHAAAVDACAGEPRYDAVIELSDGLFTADEKTFNAGLSAYLEVLEQASPEEAEELEPGEEFISVEGLAFIQLARRRNLRTQVQHRMIPEELQSVTAIMPNSGYPGWPG